MLNIIIAIALQLVIASISYFIGRYIFPKIPTNTLNNITSALSVMSKYADNYVAWAKQFMPDASGSEKMDTVVKSLQDIANKCGIKMEVTEIQAIAQAAYNAMQKGLNDASKE